MVRLNATNISKQPEPFSTDSSSIIDAQGREYDALVSYALAGQDFGTQDVPPSTGGSAMLVFDVPPTVTKVSTILVQTDPYMATENPVTKVVVTQADQRIEPLGPVETSYSGPVEGG